MDQNGGDRGRELIRLLWCRVEEGRGGKLRQWVSGGPQGLRCRLGLQGQQGREFCKEVEAQAWRLWYSWMKHWASFHL